MKKMTPKTIAVIAVCLLVAIAFAIAIIGKGAKACTEKREEAEWLKALEEMTEEPFAEFSFPTDGIAARLPAPKSNIGRIVSDSSDYFHIKVGETSQADFTAYVEDCKEKGFTVDYDKTSSRYSAYDQEGYYLCISYDSDDSVMDITLDAPEKETKAPTENTTEKATEKPTQAPETKSPDSKTDSSPAVNQSTIRDDIKEAIDSYEEFVDEYCEFMKKYDPSDTSLLSEYLELLSKEAEMTEKFEAIEDKDLTDAEAAYYAEVSLRCTQKLLEVASVVA
ncbi:MAG: hypothetical protein IJJ15_10245 [Ruminococcus sp.]|nr:hypothetical protein [Ruminococcus sp.]